jgi:hypothetical protein
MTKKNAAAQALRAIPSRKRAQASRLNGRQGGRPRTAPPKDRQTVMAHSDGTISYWSDAEQRWYTRIQAVSSKQLAALPPTQRVTVLKLLGPRG